MLEIDGSQGEGGGQILRSSLGLSMVTGKPFRISKIRAGREKPGLLRQHLTAVNAAVAVCGADAAGAAIGSRELTFIPGKVKGGEYSFAVGTAGSTTLVLQAILPGLLVADAPSLITLEGGTHNPFAPPVDFLGQAFLPILGKMGAKVAIALERAGFYPAGGGRFVASIEPASRLTPLALRERGAIVSRVCKAVVAGLPGEIAMRELEILSRKTAWGEECFRPVQLSADQGPGNVVTIALASEHVTEVFTGFGTRGIRAEAVAEEALGQARDYLAADVPLGTHLADQLLIPFALAGGGSFVTQSLTPHTVTNIDVVRKFLEVQVKTSDLGKGRWVVEFGNTD
ncbi:MAG: rtcA [Phycisphaerales bacterium]|jgi:RNA 3'-terminal phosphate cyclase (ATP)|nr:rtcA [Phycisphaerales bacterium]